MKTNKQILELLSSLSGLEPPRSQQLDLNSFDIKQSFDQFLSRLSCCDAGTLSKNSDGVTQILNRVSLLHLILIMNQIDENFPGLSFYYVMEARSYENIEGKFFIQRLQTLKQKSLLDEIFAPMRNRLINGLLAESDVKNSDISKIIEGIDNSFDLPVKDLQAIKNILLSANYKKEDLQLPVLSHRELLLLLDCTLNNYEDEDYDSFDEDDDEEF